jgi:hypothetical protein
MSFFANSSGFIVSGGTYINYNNFQTENAAASGRSIQVFSFQSLAIDDTEYSHNRWAYGSVPMGDHRQAVYLICSFSVDSEVCRLRAA